MTLKSMTGFGRSAGVHGETSWHWEVRSVNGRGLELRFRMPSGLEGLEIKARSLAQEMLARGNCTLNLTLRRETGELAIRLNEAALSQALAAAKRAQGLTQTRRRASTLCSACGAWLRWRKGKRARRRMRSWKMPCSRGLRAALDQLVAARTAEGARLTTVMANQLSQIASLVERAASASARQPVAIVQRLGEQIARLMESSAGLDPERLHQEALLLAAKSDIQEELDRLRSHVTAAQDLLAQDQPVGRRLEFLAQEFNREANTICSKASDIEISRTGLELKTVIDQLREQVQNIE